MKTDLTKYKRKDGTFDADRLASEKPLFPQVDRNRDEFHAKVNRDRKELPDRLPTAGLLPMPIDDHELIGELETKQNIYLTFAHAYNKLIDRIEKLEAKMDKRSIDK